MWVLAEQVGLAQGSGLKFRILRSKVQNFKLLQTWHSDIQGFSKVEQSGGGDDDGEGGHVQHREDHQEQPVQHHRHEGPVVGDLTLNRAEYRDCSGAF